MDKMVISFAPDGSVEHTLNDDFIKLEGHRKIERVTEIPFSEPLQMFFIRWLLGPFEGLAHTFSMARQYGIIYAGADADPASPIFFQTYKQAVAHEVECLNAMRLAGVRFSNG